MRERMSLKDYTDVIWSAPATLEFGESWVFDGLPVRTIIGLLGFLPQDERAALMPEKGMLKNLAKEMAHSTQRDIQLLLWECILYIESLEGDRDKLLDLKQEDDANIADLTKRLAEARAESKKKTGTILYQGNRIQALEAEIRRLEGEDDGK